MPTIPPKHRAAALKNNNFVLSWSGVLNILSVETVKAQEKMTERKNTKKKGIRMKRRKKMNERK